jgi:hypothetical protein
LPTIYTNTIRAQCELDCDCKRVEIACFIHCYCLFTVIRHFVMIQARILQNNENCR